MRITVNDREHEVDAAGDARLLAALRNGLGLDGPKYGRGLAECGACTMLVGGRPARACVRSLTALRGRAVTTLVPGFVDVFDDRQIADLAACLRRTLAPERPAWADLPVGVARARGH